MPKKPKKTESVIIPVESEDKKALDPEPPQDHPLSMPRGSRCWFLAPPGHGKTSCSKNCLIRSSPWAAVVIISGVGEHTSEWEKVVHTATNFEEATENWWGALSKKHDGKPIACVVDDMNYADLSPKERSNAYKLVQFVCTHLNVTAFMASHSWVQLIPRLRRACGVVVMWPTTTGGQDQLTYNARSLGLPKPLIEAAFDACGPKYEPVVFYTNPPPGRVTVMVGFDRPFFDAG